MTRWLLLIPVTLALGGCAETAATRSQMFAGASAASNGLAPSPSNPSPGAIQRRKAAATATAVAAPDREAELASLRKDSPEWWALHDAIEKEADASLAKRLIICSGCFAKDNEDHISSIR